MFADRLLGAHQRILRERFAFDIVGDITRVVVLAVTGQAQSRCDHELRRTAGTRTFHRAADHIETLREIGAVNRVPFKSISNRAIDQIVAGKLAIVRRRVSVMVVRRHEHERHALDRGDVHAFMRRAGLHAAFADSR